MIGMEVAYSRPRERVLTYIGLILRSAPKERVSKDEAAPSFETGAARPPQDEGG
jgi:hypothetical protein